MSYNNNWVKSLTESYAEAQQPSNLQEELNEQVALNEDLLVVIEALCEELGIDMEELLQLDEGWRRVSRLGKAKYEAEKRGEPAGPGSPIGRAYTKAMRKSMRSEDKRELRDGAIENRIKFMKKYPGPSQPRGFASYGL